MMIFADYKVAILISLGLFLIFGSILYWTSQPLICECGYIKFWYANPVGSGNSQHIADWYTFSHVIHGFIFYWIAWLIGRKRGWPVWFMLLLALGIEMGWELFENSNFIIDRYRSATVSKEYFGDSVLNSVSDVLAMVIGFIIAWRLPAWLTVLILVGLELYVGYMIRDNLTLNIIMLIYPAEFILRWQQGA
ncbi:DUF2585 family protein [Candidatus Giovannonibacteria bacterium]|nr:DUF2585 family protein [Candidatus Giovannonibacteria bacterium]